MDIEFLKSRYDQELERKDKLTDALALPVGVLSVFVGANVAMAQSFSYTDPWLMVTFLLCIAAVAVAFYGCVYRLWRAYHAQVYVYLPLLWQIEQWEEDTREFLAYVREIGGGSYREDDFNITLRTRIIAAADHNTESNDTRAKWMHQSRVWLFAVFCFTSLAGFSYVGDRVRFMVASDQAPKPSQAQPAPRPEWSVRERPPFPPNRVIKEGTDGIEKKRG